MLWKGILNLDICFPWSEAVFMLNTMKMAISDSEQSHSSNGLFFSLTCKQPLRHTALLINCDFELWSITCIHLPLATSSVNSNMTKTALLVKSDFELWSVTCIEHELWPLTSSAHGQFNLFTKTFNWIYILSQWLVPFNRSLLITFLNFNFTFFLLADRFRSVVSVCGSALQILYNCWRCSFGRTYFRVEAVFHSRPPFCSKSNLVRRNYHHATRYHEWWQTQWCLSLLLPW